MLESVIEPGQRHYFKDLESLKAYLLTQHEPASEQEDAEGENDI